MHASSLVLSGIASKRWTSMSRTASMPRAMAAIGPGSLPYLAWLAGCPLSSRCVPDAPPGALVCAELADIAGAFRVVVDAESPPATAAHCEDSFGAFPGWSGIRLLSSPSWARESCIRCLAGFQSAERLCASRRSHPRRPRRRPTCAGRRCTIRQSRRPRPSRTATRGQESGFSTARAPRCP